jgi:hypothetical protein
LPLRRTLRAPWGVDIGEPLNTVLAMKSPLLILLASWMVVGCAESPSASSAPATSPAEPAGGDVFGWVRLRAESARVSGFELATVDGAFARYAGMDEATLRHAFDVWSPPAAEGCAWVGSGQRAAADARVELLSAGWLGLVGGGETLRLAPRPLLGGGPVRGLIYGTDDDVSPSLTTGDRFLLWADGDVVGAFAALMAPPEAAEIVAVDGVEIGAAREVEVSENAALTIEWLQTRGPVFVSVSADGVAMGPSLECRVEGASSITLDRPALWASLGGPQAIDVVVRTATREALPAGAGVGGAVSIERLDRVTVRSRAMDQDVAR